MPGALLLILPDEVRIRQVRRLLKPARVPAFMALERDVVLAGEDAIWSSPSLNARFDLRSALKRAHPGLPLRVERRQVRASIPWGINAVRPGPDLPGCLLPSLIKPTEKRVLDLVSDWPWVTSEDVAGILGVSGTRVSQLLNPLEEHDLVTRVQAAGRRLALTDLGLAMLARRDRASVGVARKRWSVRTSDPHAPFSWHNISGRRSRQLLRYMEHTAAVHRFVASMACQARSAGWKVAQIDPPHRASRYFQHDGKLRSVQPDAFGILRTGTTVRPFFLEWERRAVRPVTMADRLAPYLRYFSSHRPIDDHGVQPIVLVVLHDAIAQTHFMRVARQELSRTGMEVPLLVSHSRLLERTGPLRPVWHEPDNFEPAYAFQTH